MFSVQAQQLAKESNLHKMPSLHCQIYRRTPTGQVPVFKWTPVKNLQSERQPANQHLAPGRAPCISVPEGKGRDSICCLGARGSLQSFSLVLPHLRTFPRADKHLLDVSLLSSSLQVSQGWYLRLSHGYSQIGGYYPWFVFQL